MVYTESVFAGAVFALNILIGFISLPIYPVRILLSSVKSAIFCSIKLRFTILKQ